MNSEREKSMSNKKPNKADLIYAARMLVVVIVLFGVPILLFTWGTPKNLTVDYDTDVLEVCIDPEMNTDLAVSLEKGSRIAVGILGTSEVHEWQFELPDTRIPKDRNQVAVVICVDNGGEVIDTCKYTGSTGAFEEKIVMYRTELFVIERESKVAFTSASFQGDPPKFMECPLSYNNSSSFRGELPTELFLEWVELNIP